MNSFDFDMVRIKNIHLVGIGGCGMSAIAKILFEMGYSISGSDLKESANTMRLRDLGIEVFYSHQSSNIRRADLVVVSTAINKNNVELLEAANRRIKIIHRAEMLNWILNQSKTSIAISGTHGKTTTTSMLSLVFDKCNLNPTYLIGGERNDAFGNAKLGNGSFSIAEADESDGSFLKLAPLVGVITNIEPDHLDYFNSISQIVEAFDAYIQKVQPGGYLVVCADDSNCRFLVEKNCGQKKFITYGFNYEADLRAINPTYEKYSSSYLLSDKGEEVGQVSLGVPGFQNIVNSLAAYAVGFEAGLDFAAITNALRSFAGTRRRFQLIAEIEEISIIDDYAHHPTEIAVTLAAARLGWGLERRLICVFQPHRFSRTMLLKKEFGQCFKDADLVIITDVYAAGEIPIAGISGKTIVDEIIKTGNQNVEYIPQKEKIPQFLLDNLKKGDMLLTLGAGDIFTVGKEVYTLLKNK